MDECGEYINGSFLQTRTVQFLEDLTINSHMTNVQMVLLVDLFQSDTP